MSERTLSDPIKDATASDVVAPFFAVSAEFPSGTVRLWAGGGSLTFGGNTYEGVGEFLSIEAITETVDGSANGVALTLSGIPTDIQSPILDDDYQGNAAEVFLGCFDPNDGSILADPVTIFRGHMDTDTVKEDGKTSSIVLRVENRIVDLLRSREHRYTLEGQRTLRMGDELVTNGNFASDISGWTKSGDAASTIEWDNGRLKVTAATNYDGAVQSVTGLVSGKSYKFSAEYEFGSATQLQIRAGSEPSTDLSSPTSGTAVNYFTASGTSMSIYVRTGGSTGTIYFDNVSVREISEDEGLEFMPAMVESQIEWGPN